LVHSDDTTFESLDGPIFVRGADDGVTHADDIEVYVQHGSKDLIVAHNRTNGGLFDFVGFQDPPLGEWFHLAVVYDGTDVRAYYNGLPAAVVHGSTAMVAPFDTDKGWLIGKVNHLDFGGFGERYFDGRMDEVRFWDSALTAGEVAASHHLAVLSQFAGVDMDSAVPGVKEVSSEGVLTFFISAVHDTVSGDDRRICNSPDQTVANVDILISLNDAFDERRKAWTPKPAGSSWNETASDTSAIDDVCATVHDVVYGARAKTLHLHLNVVDFDTDAPLTGGVGTIIDQLGVNIQRKPLGD
jgi:hypothetical protein